VIIDMSTLIYVSIFILLTLSSKNLNDVGQLDSTLAAEWCASLGTIAMVPRLFELVLEYGPLEGIMIFVPSTLPCMMMFTFVNKSIATAVVETIATGEAHYIATGRPNANTHYSWRECYFLFVRTHFYPGLQILFLWLIYTLLSFEFEVSSLPMFIILFTALMWINAPVFFCPQPTLVSLARDMSELWAFVIAVPDSSIRQSKVEKNKTTENMLRASFGDMRATLFEFWLKENLEHKKQGSGRRLTVIFYEFAKLWLFLSVIYSSMIDNFWDFIALFLFNWVLWDTWRLLSRPTFWLLLVIMIWILSPFLYFDMPWINFFCFVILLIQTLSCVKQIILFFAWFYYNVDTDWPSMPEGTTEQRVRKAKVQANDREYDMVVEYLFVNFLTHLVHLLCGILLTMMWFCVQLVCVLADMLWGFHSWFILNGNLRSAGCCARRVGFEPNAGHRSPHSKRYLELSSGKDD